MSGAAENLGVFATERKTLTNTLTIHSSTYLQVLLKANRQDLSHGGSSLTFLRFLLMLTNYGFFSQILAEQPGASSLKSYWIISKPCAKCTVGVIVLLVIVPKVVTCGLPLANDCLPLHRLPGPAMAMEVVQQRKHPGNGSALNKADEYAGTLFKSA